MRVLWPFGGSLLDKTFHSNLTCRKARQGLNFRQDLMKVHAAGHRLLRPLRRPSTRFAQRQVAMITEWSAFYGTLTDPKTSKLGDCLAVAPEPAGPAGRLPALGGFSLAVASQAREAAQKAAWIFIQWATSEAIARALCRGRRRLGPHVDLRAPDIKAKYKFVEPMVASWQKGVPEFRPRFPAWPAISEVVAEFGSKMMLGEVPSRRRRRSRSAPAWRTILKKEGYYDGKKRSC